MDSKETKTRWIKNIPAELIQAVSGAWADGSLNHPGISWEVAYNMVSLHQNIHQILPWDTEH